MKKKLQVILNKEAWAKLQLKTDEANNNFSSGRIVYSDVINEAICSANINITKLQAKHINVKKSLRNLSTQKDIDIDSAIETLMALKKGATTKAKIAAKNRDLNV